MEEERYGTDLVRSQVQIFNNEEFGQVRVVNKNGEPWLVGKDVAESKYLKEVAVTSHMIWKGAKDDMKIKKDY